MKIYERTPCDEIRSLARLMLVDEQELLAKAQTVQPGLTKLDDMGFHTYHFLMGVLLAKQSKPEPGPLPFEPDEIEYEDEEEEDEEEWEDKRTEDQKYWDGYWAYREDSLEARDIDRAIEKGWI